MKRLDLDEAEVHVKACVYGQPGTGKTTFGVSAPSPLILLSERQGLANVRAAAKRTKRPVPPTLYMEKLSDYRRVLRAIMAGAPTREVLRVTDDKGAVEYEGPFPETLVIDSITDACSLVREEIVAEAPPEKAKDGLEKWSERHWAALRDRSEKLIRAFRNAPCNVLFLALLDDRTTGEGEQQERSVGPLFPMRALPGFLSSCVSVVGITTREIKSTRGDDAQREIVYGIRTTGPSYYMLKPFRPLKDEEVPDFASWVERIRAAGAAGEKIADAAGKAGE